MKPINQVCRPWNVYPPVQKPCGDEMKWCGQCGDVHCGGYLLPRVITGAREWLRCCEVLLRVEDLPEHAPRPLKLTAVCAAGEPVWTQTQDVCRRRLCLQVNIPLCCQVEDGCGCVHCGRSVVTVDAAMPLPMAAAECWRGTMMILPCVRLVNGGCAAQDACFDARLEICLACYMVRWEHLMAPCKSQCPPPLPLYPQPVC